LFRSACCIKRLISSGTKAVQELRQLVV